jgi:hypothetical protein
MIKSKIAIAVALVAALSTPGLAQSPYNYGSYAYGSYAALPPAYAYAPYGNGFADYAIPGSREAQVEETGN